MSNVFNRAKPNLPPPAPEPEDPEEAVGEAISDLQKKRKAARRRGARGSSGTLLSGSAPGGSKTLI